MQEQIEKNSGSTVRPPEGLFQRIIKRLGLEKQLTVVKRYLGFSIAALAICFVLFSFALLGFRAIMDETSFGPLMSLVVSDPGIALRYWHSFVFSFFELMPGMNLALMFLMIALLMVFLRLIVVYSQKFASILSSIHKNKYNQHDK